MPAAPTHESPDFSGLVGAAFNHAPALAVDGGVVEGIAHRNRSVFRLTLAPCLGKVALQELHIGNAVDDAFAGVGGEFLGKI